jgi:CubicO group peptidase (beta-lactamase class C family)
MEVRPNKRARDEEEEEAPAAAASSGIFSRLFFLLLVAAAAGAGHSAATSSSAAAAAADNSAALAALSAWRAARRMRPPAAAADAPCPDLPAAVPLPAGAAPPPAPLAGALAALSAQLAAAVNATSLPGGALAVTYRGATLLNASAGAARKGGAAPSTGGTLWRVASVSKLLPAVLLSVMSDADGGGARSGALRRDDAVAAFAPAFAPRNPFDASRPTFAQLATHTSGLQREAPFGANSTAAALAALSAPGAPLVLPPGARPSYSNLGFAVLGHVLAELVARPPAELPDLVREQVLTPLGMVDTGYDYDTPGVAERLAQGYDAAGDPVAFYEMGWAYPAGSAYASVDDLSRLAAGLLAAANGTGSAGGLALSAGAARELLAPRFYNRDGKTLFGSPWETLVVPVADPVGGNVLALLKGGNIPGYTAVVALVPELELTLAAAFNGGADEFAFAEAALGVLVPALVSTLAALAPVPAYNPSPDPAAYVGTYTLGDTEVLVRFEQGQLLWFCSAVGAQVILDHLEGDLFRAAFPDSSFPCLLGELEALRYQVVAFGRGDGGVVATTQMAGWIPGAVWTRA